MFFHALACPSSAGSDNSRHVQQCETMGSGASVLCGGRPRLQLYCIDMRMAWCNGLVMYEDGTVRSIDNNDDDILDIEIEAVDSDEVELVSDTDDDYDHEDNEG